MILLKKLASDDFWVALFRHIPNQIVKDLLLASILWINLRIYDFPFDTEISVLFLVGKFFFKTPMKLFNWTNVLMALFFGSMFVVNPPSIFHPVNELADYVVKVDPSFSTPKLIGLNIALMLICFTLYWLLYRWIQKFPKSPKLLIMSGLFVALLFLFKSLPQEEIATWAVLGLIAWYSKGFWMMLYQFSEVHLLTRYSALTHFLTVSPFWQQTWGRTAVPRGLSEYLNASADPLRSEKASVAGLKLLVWANVLLLVNHLFVELLRFLSTWQSSLAPWLYAPNLRNISLYSYFAIDWRTCTFYLFAKCFVFFLILAHKSHVIVGIAQAFGFDIPRNFNNPFRSSSFNDFIHRIYYYYIAILQRVFFFPIWSYLRWVRQKNLRIWLTTFLTILIGGILNAYLRAVQVLPRQSLADYVTSIDDRYLYFVCLGAALGLSSVYRQPPAFLQSSRLYSYLRVPFYFLLYCFCFTLQS